MADKTNSILQEYKDFQYDLEDYSWKEKSPSVTITKSSKITKNPKVSVVIANFNNEPYLKRMMDSLVNQTLGIENIQVLFCDDRSTDNSLEIVLPYVEKYPNIEIYLLNKNTGGAHGPRNVGLQYIRGEYLVILDSDDWYAEDGLKILSNLLDQSTSDIVFGGIVRNQNGKMDLFSPAYVERDAIDRSIEDLPYEFFNWMGPQGNMVRTSTVKKFNLHFVDQRVADDVTFFYQILRLSGTISQTNQLTIYLNRDDDNISLSKAVNETFLVSWLRALSYIKENYSIDQNLERFMSRRLEWLTLDFALRWDTAYGMSLDSVTKMADLIQQYLGELSFNPSDYFYHQPQKIAWQYLMERRFDDLVKFVSWHSLSALNKRIEKINNNYYFIPEDQSIPKIEIPVVIRGGQVSIVDDKLLLEFSLYTKESFNRVEIRNDRQPFNRMILSTKKISETLYQITLKREDYAQLLTGVNKFFVILNDYDEHMIAIGDTQQYCMSENVIVDASGVVAVFATNPSRYFVTRATEKSKIGEVIHTQPSFDSEGEKSQLLPNGEIINNKHFYNYEIPNRLSDLSDEELMALYSINLGIMNAKANIPVYQDKFSADEGKESCFIIKDKVFINYNIDFSPKGELLYFVGSGFIKAKEAQFIKPKKEKVVINKYIYTYPSQNFNEDSRLRMIAPSTKMEVVELAFDENNIPRFLTVEGDYITEKPEFVSFVKNRDGRRQMQMEDLTNFARRIKNKLNN